MKNRRPKIAFWFRYGPGEHTELLHALPEIIEALAKECEVHYFGLRSAKPVPEKIRQNAAVHLLPLTVRRTSEKDKLFKTILWILLLPLVALKSRSVNIDAIYIDETIPLTTPIARLFFGRKVAVTVADFFVDIYLPRGLGRFIRNIDMNSWRKLPLIFTRAKSTKAYLAKQGIAPEKIVPVYDPCDLSIYRPVDKKTAKQKMSFGEENIVLVHHGILHPNKGNDWILRAIQPLQTSHPHFRYLLVGDGPEMENLKNLTRELKLEKMVVFTGWLPSLEQVNTALNAGDIGLVMRVGQEADNFHMTGALVHSMACGLAVLAAQLSGVLEVIQDGENGFTFPPTDPELFRKKLIALIENAELRQRFGRAALEKAKESFDMKTMTQQTVEPLVRLAKS